jgi:hypothetical protein
VAVIYTPNQLGAIAAVLAEAADTWDWAGTGAERKIEEVQCMVYGGQLFIAANTDKELAHVKHLLAAFAITSDADLLSCVKLCWLVLSAPHPERKAFFGKGANLKASATVNAAVGLAGAFLSPDQNAKTAAKALLTLPLTEPEESKQRQRDCMRKMGGLPAVRDPKPSDAGFGSVGITALESAKHEVNLVTGGNDNVHAELRLLTHAYHGISAAAGTEAKIQLGGLKPACGCCKHWIANFAKCVPDAKIEQTSLGGRSEHHGAGKRPTLAVSATGMLKTLFDGGSDKLPAPKD